MAVKYHYTFRKHLNSLSNCKDEKLAARQNKAKNLLVDYHSDPEESLAAQIQFYQNLIEQQNQFYDEQVYQKKSWWQKILYFLGWKSQEESEYLAVIKEAKKDLKNAQKQQNPMHWYEKIIWYFVRKFIELVMRHKNTERTLSYLSHRTLLMVTDVPEYLEGSLGVDSFHDYCQDLQSFLDELPSNFTGRHRIESIQAKLRQCQQIEESLLIIRSQQSFFEKKDGTYDFEGPYIQDRVFEILDTIVNLKIGEKSLVQHGFVSKEGAHATVFEIEKVSDEGVRFRFYNIGAGLYGVASWKTLFVNLLTDRNQAPVKVTNEMTIESLISSDFIEQLVIPTIITSNTVEEGIRKMNTPLVQLRRLNKLHDDKRKVHFQLMGSCGQSCIDAWVETILNESEFVQFYCFRLKQSISKIDLLLSGDSLNDEESIYCQRMRLAAQVELAYLSGRLIIIAEQLDQDINNAFKKLQQARIENSSSKGKEPKELNINDINDYCQRKLFEERLTTKFSDVEQRDIMQVNHNSKVSVQHRKKKASTANKLSLGLLGTKTVVPLSEIERRQNKLAKTKLCQKITSLDHQKTMCKQLLFISQQHCRDTQEQRQIDDLVAKRTKHQEFSYSDLTIQ